MQGTTVHGIGSPGSPQREPNYRVIPEPWDNRDCIGGLECPTEILQSPVFKLDASGPISVDMMGGRAQGTISFDPDTHTPPEFPDDHDFNRSSSGWQGFALYDIAADEYVRWGFPSFENDGKQRDGRDVWETVTIPQEDLAELAGDGKDYRVDIFDSYLGGWGWIGFDTVRIPDADLPSRWTGEGSDNLWNNPANWDTGAVPSGGDVFINGPAAGAPNGPMITDGTSAVAGILISDSGTASMSMSGGTLELTDWGAWWADDQGVTAHFNMSGGEVTFTGNPGILEFGWQPDGAPVGSSAGIWDMTGGVINAKGIDMPGDGEDGNPGSGTINLNGGTINVGTARGGLMMYEGAHIDIRGSGKLVLEGEQLQVEGYIDNGWITAFGGTDKLVMEFDGDFTTLSALGLIGDCNFDGVLDAADLDCVATIEERDAVLASLNTLPGDLNGNGDVAFADFLVLSDNFGDPTKTSYSDGNIDLMDDVAFADFLVLSANFGKTPAAAGTAAAVPEPSSLALLSLGGLLAALTRRRRP